MEDFVARDLTTTSRQDLRGGAGVNTHFCFNPSVYAVGKKPNQLMIDDIIGLGVAYIRERWVPTNVARHNAFTQLTNAGVRLYLFVGDMTYGPSDIANEVAALAASPFVNSVEAVCGPNEPNKNGGSPWAKKVTNLQQAIYNTVFGMTAYAAFAPDIAVVGPALKHNVPDVDGDYQAVAAAGIQRWCSAGDFHFYPGNAGARGAVRPGLPDDHEAGLPGDQDAPDDTRRERAVPRLAGALPDRGRVRRPQRRDQRG